MSKASRRFKARCKKLNELCGYTLTIKEMSLKAYRKECRYCRTYVRGMKQHDKYMKGIASKIK